MQHFGRRVRLRIEDRHEIRAVLCRSVNFSVGVDRRIAPIGRDGIVEIGRRVAPVPQRDNDVAFDTLRTFGLREGQLTGGNTVGPVGEQSQRDVGIEPSNVACHECTRTPGLKTPRPRIHRLVEHTEFLRDSAHSFCTEGVA